MVSRKDIVPPGMEVIRERFHYAPGVLVDGTLYIAGQVGRDANLHVVAGTEAQFVQAFENVKYGLVPYLDYLNNNQPRFLVPPGKVVQV